MPLTRITLGWRDLTGVRGTEADVSNLVKGLNCISGLVSLARINILLAVDRFHNQKDVTVATQGFLAGNFLDDDVLSLLKAKFGSERLDVRSLFHSQQVLLLARYILIYGAAEGGSATEESVEARGTLGRCLLMVTDLLVSRKMAADLRNKTISKPKKSVILQLSAASGFEVNNPPNMKSSIVRSDTLFGDILKRIPSKFDLAAIFRERTGMNIDEYLDFNIGALVNYIAREPKELLGTADPYFLNPATFFPAELKRSADCFWNLELGTWERYREELKGATKLQPHHNFTAFRKRPFFRTNGTCMPLHPCFVQEKLEAGLFWTIFHTLKDDSEREALFSLWGRLYETYIIETLTAATDGKSQFVPFPKYSDNNQEAFDGILSDGKICVVFESKAGFLKAESKFSEDLDLLIPDLEEKFGSSRKGALSQIATNITQAFDKKRPKRRTIQGVELGNTQVVVPVLVVQEKFVSSPMTAYFLADSFRSVLRKQRLTRDIDCQCQGLIVMDAYDVEALRVCNADSAFNLLRCIFERSRLGDQVYDFHDFIIDYAKQNGFSLKSDALMDARAKVIFDRISQRFFPREVSGDTQPSASA
jgi:hypothetical protein